MAPNYAKAQREMRRARVQSALGLMADHAEQSKQSDVLLDLIAPLSLGGVPEFGTLREDTLDTVMSVALAETDQSGGERVVNLLLAIIVLAKQGEFARLRILGSKLIQLTETIATSRRFWRASLFAFGLDLSGDRVEAIRLLRQTLHAEGTAPAQEAPSGSDFHEIVAAAAVLGLLEDGANSPLAALVRGRTEWRYGSESLLYLDAAAAWIAATEAADPRTVIPDADEIFRTEPLASYLHHLNVHALFPAQIAVIEAGATHNQNALVALPTSSGKTLVAELRIVASLVRTPGSCVIYVAPYRLLCRQVVERLHNSVGSTLGFGVVDLSADDGPGLSDQVQVAVCTPERLDSMLRLATADRRGSEETSRFLKRCSTVVVDEMHLLAREGRGPRLELIVTRFREAFPKTPLLALSAAAVGAHDVAAWLESTSSTDAYRRPTGTLEVVWATNGDLRQRVSRHKPTSVDRIERERPRDDVARLVAGLRADSLPALAVCTSRQNAETVARSVRGSLSGVDRPLDEFGQGGQASIELLALEEIAGIMGESHPLVELINSRVAYHHAGLPSHVLDQIEVLAKAGSLLFVASTTTVAEGADLPFRTVIIPHLNFPGASGKLDRDLYLNIVGRAGRAGVAAEGLVVLLDSDARTLANHVARSLWSYEVNDRLEGKISTIRDHRGSKGWFSEFADLQSQLLGWLGDGKAYREDQSAYLASKTFSYVSGSPGERAALVEIFDEALGDLEARGLIVAGSPFALTPEGLAVRRSGLAPASVKRLRRALAESDPSLVLSLNGCTSLSTELAQRVAKLAMESVEVFEASLVFRHAAPSNDTELQVSLLKSFAEGSYAYDVESEFFKADVDLISSWIQGESFHTIAQRAPTYPNSNSLFGGKDLQKRISDATEYIGKVSYPASRTWAGVSSILDEGVIPSFVPGCIEEGVRTEAAAWLVQRYRVTRSGANRLAEVGGETVVELRQWLEAFEWRVPGTVPLTTLDRQRLSELR